jgi:hypothetical protein
MQATSEVAGSSTQNLGIKGAAFWTRTSLHFNLKEGRKAWDHLFYLSGKIWYAMGSW